MNFFTATLRHKKMCFFLQGEKDAECSETLKYALGKMSSYFEFFP